MIKKKEPNYVDRHVGQRVRARRLAMGMSQNGLGERLGLTFQQVQKYEKGTNRIGASRMHQIATALGCETSYFFEDLPGSPVTYRSPDADKAMFAVQSMATSRQGMDVVRAFAKLPPSTRNAFVALLTAVAGRA